MVQSNRNHLLNTILCLIFIITVGITAVLSRPVMAKHDAADHPNIIFIVVDALRADHVSSYGYARTTTPKLDSWVADKGVLFTDATAASSWTNPSNGAMLTSHAPSTIDTVWSDMTRQIPDSEKMLAEYLHDAGYTTAGFVSNWWLRAMFGYDQGFDFYQHTTGDDARRAIAINELAMNWLDNNLDHLNNGDQPLFLFLYYLDPHTWYDPPPPYDTMYDDSYTGMLTAEVYGHGEDVVSGEIVPSERDIAHLIALYDGEITYWDYHLGELFDYLDSNGLMDDSIVVVTSDHGQMFGEHGKWVHRNSLYEEVIRVPLLFRYPGQIDGGQVLSAPVHMMDISPTILDMIGLPVPGHMQGQSLLPLMKGGEPPQSRPIFSEMAGETDPQSDAYWIAPRTDLYSVKKDGWKFIHAQQTAQDDQLFMVQPATIYEQENLANVETDKAEELFSLLKDTFDIPTEFLFFPLVESN